MSAWAWPGFLRAWRRRRRLSQLSLALETGPVGSARASSRPAAPGRAETEVRVVTVDDSGEAFPGGPPAGVGALLARRPGSHRARSLAIVRGVVEAQRARCWPRRAAGRGAGLLHSRGGLGAP